MMKQGIGIGIIVLNENDEVLLLLRNSDGKIADSDMHYEGQYTLPAGKVRFGESFENAAIRKVKEETNLEINNPQVICLLNDYNEYAHYATIGAITKEYSGSIELGEGNEHVSYIWTRMDSLPSNLCKSSRKIIERYNDGVWYKKED